MSKPLEEKFPCNTVSGPPIQAYEGRRRVSVVVRGIVQGVGFRPFIHQLALSRDLEGWVRNSEDGVEIEVCGPLETVDDFVRDISVKAPPLSRITSVESAPLPFQSLGPFRIIASSSIQTRSTLVSPDASTCSDCLRELFDPANRRFRYPFINCTNCGPRYTIIKDIPYDRYKTTMSVFQMCPKCAAEYENPADRRFHAQPNACWSCGPDIWLADAAGIKISSGGDTACKAIELLEAGAILAIKGLGGFHLAVKATDETAVRQLRARKIREEKPFAVMFASMEEIRRHCRVGDAEEELLLSQARPIVLLEKLVNPVIASSVAPRNRFLGAFLPYTPLHYLLFENAPYRSLVMTSGNQSDEPIVTENIEALNRLGGIADYFLLHDRDIHTRCDDSVIRVLSGKVRHLRRARGYVPVPVFLRDKGPSVLGTGAELKNTICLTRENQAFLSQHIGDLENLETLNSFENAVEHLEKLLEIRPELVVHDLHPDYLNTQWAHRQDRLPRLAVQHHHAHIASVIAERRMEGPVIGLAMDGTGYGGDGTIWGGEVLMVEGAYFKRLGYFRQVPLPGGTAAIKEPWRMALSYLWSIDRENVESRFARFLEKWPENRRVVLKMLSKRLNSPLTSSCGRLFDAVAAICGIRSSINYEGQAAIELEQAIELDDVIYEGRISAACREANSPDGAPLPITDSRLPAVAHGAPFILDTFPIIEAVVADLEKGMPSGKISARFHNGMVQLLVDAVKVASKICNINQVALSGGVFQNAVLAEKLEKELSSLGFDVWSHLEIPPNDACISLGQAYIGTKKLAEGI